MKSKLTIEITIEEEGVRLMLDGTFHGTPHSKVTVISTLIRDLGLDSIEALCAVAQAFDEDFDDGHISGEETTIELRLPHDE